MRGKRITKSANALLKIAKGDYLPDLTEFATDSERVHRAKIALQKLTQADRTIIILYAETASLREVARMLNVSHTTIRSELQRIRNELFKIMNIKQ